MEESASDKLLPTLYTITSLLSTLAQCTRHMYIHTHTWLRVLMLLHPRFITCEYGLSYELTAHLIQIWPLLFKFDHSGTSQFKFDHCDISQNPFRFQSAFLACYYCMCGVYVHTYIDIQAHSHVRFRGKLVHVLQFLFLCLEHPKALVPFKSKKDYLTTKDYVILNLQQLSHEKKVFCTIRTSRVIRKEYFIPELPSVL